MKFYNREKEIALLGQIRKKSLKTAQMTFVVGRRRIGKTSLLVKECNGSKYVYLFAAKKNEALLCSDFEEEIKRKLNSEVYGSLKTFKDVFGYLMTLSKKMHFTLIIDEFQEFRSINPSVYSDMQNIWDRMKGESKVNLILCGSLYSLMKNIFENSKEPLFGRATQRIHLKEFNTGTLKKILADNKPGYTAEDLLSFYMITGGVAKYAELLTDAGSFTNKSIIDDIFSDNSLFIEEGRNVLIDEFGKDYGNYFSILSLISSSKTSRIEMESILEMNIGGFLERLESDFGLIRKVKPIFSKPGSRTVKYEINDNFLNFWFRFIYKNRSAIETGNLKYVKEIVQRDYKTYSGKVLEKYFRQKLMEEGKYSEIGSYWEKGNKNEIDIIGVNEKDKRLLIADVKRKAENIDIAGLKQKADKLVSKLKGYKIMYKGFSMKDV